MTGVQTCALPICFPVTILASMAGMYTVYHGAEGIKDIAGRIHAIATYLNEILPVYGYSQENENFFDTLKISLVWLPLKACAQLSQFGNLPAIKFSTAAPKKNPLLR